MKTWKITYTCPLLTKTVKVTAVSETGAKIAAIRAINDDHTIESASMLLAQFPEMFQAEVIGEEGK